MMRIRLATEADLDAMTWVLIGASPLDPVYPYRFPDRHLYADLFAELCRQKCAEYLTTSTVVVCEMASDSDPDDMKVIAFSAWDAPHLHCSIFGDGNVVGGMHSPRPKEKRRITNSRHVSEPLPSSTPSFPITIGHRDRMNVFKNTCAAKKRELFDARYRPRGGHMFLKMLLCHPEYQRRGAGRALTSWGISEARRCRLDTTVFASPMGFELYKKLGFREVARFRVQLEGDEDFLEIPAMVLRPDASAYLDLDPCSPITEGFVCTTTTGAGMIACT